MPSVVDKAFWFSSTRKPKFSNLSNRSKALAYSKKLIRFPYFRLYLTNRSGTQEPDMPGAGKKSRHQLESEPTKGNANKTAPTGHNQSRIVFNTEASGVRGQSTSTTSQDKSSVAKNQCQIERQCAPARNLLLPKESKEQVARTSPDKSNPTTISSVNLDRRLKDQLRQRKKQIVDRLMAVVLNSLEKKLEPFEEPCDGEGCAYRAYGLSSSHGSSRGTIPCQPKRQTIGQKRQLQRDDRDDDETDKDDNHRKRNIKRTKTTKAALKVLKYACPYYKFDQHRFKHERTCCGPGWADIHRVKEHLQRAHALPTFQCRRCCEYFKAQADLVEHQRKARACSVRDETSTPRNLADGYDEVQGKEILKRTRKPGHDKWVDYYCILFKIKPGSSDIPSPYFDMPDATDWRQGHTSNGRFERYLNYFRQEVPPRIRQHLEHEVEKALEGVENSIKSNVLSKINSTLITLHRVFQTIPPPPGSTSEGEAEFPEPAIPSGLNHLQLFEDLEVDFPTDNLFENLEQDFQRNDTLTYRESNLGLDDGFDINTYTEQPWFVESSNSSYHSGNIYTATASSSYTSLEELPGVNKNANLWNAELSLEDGTVPNNGSYA